MPHQPPRTINPKLILMKNRIACASALALALCSQLTAWGATNGLILISTRAPQDTAASSEYATDERGPGMTSPGDVEMGNLLSHYGYSSRVVLDKILGNTAGAYCSTPAPGDIFTEPVNAAYTPALIIVSGSSASADVATRNTNAIPIMIGEHADLSDRSNLGAVFLYSQGGLSTDPNQGTGASRYMKIINTNHPITQGIPLDAQGRVKIFRDPYPEESAHLPASPKANYEYRWCSIPASNAAPATVVLGVLDGMETFSVFAVAEAGGILSNGSTNEARAVHFFVNEQGSGGTRRIFNTLTDMGRILFVRAAKWAMGETLTPYQGLGLIEVSLAGPSQIRLTWQGTPDKNYKILGTRNLAGPADFSNWQTVLQDIPGTNGLITRKFSVASATQYAFLRIQAVP
jgi:hypothetical protein